MFTTHGYRITGTPLEGRPDFRTNNGEGLTDCGGPGACDVCSVEAANATGKFELHPEYDAIKNLPNVEERTKVFIAAGLTVDQTIGEILETENALSRLAREPNL